MKLLILAVWASALACARQPELVVPPDPPLAEIEGGRPPSRTIHLGRVPHISQETTRAENAPLATYLGKQLGQHVELVIPDDYDAVIAAMERRDIDVAILPPLSYIVAKQKMPGLVVIAQLVADGGAQYLSYIVAASDGPVHALADLRGKRFAFVDKRSTTGYLLAFDVLLHNGIDPDKDFKSVVFAGSHPEVVDLVLRHKVEGGAIASTTFGHMRDDHLNDRLRIIGKSEPVPFDAVVVQPTLPPETIDELRETLLALSSRTDEGRAVLTGVTLNNGFVPATDAAYDGVRRIASAIANHRP